MVSSTNRMSDDVAAKAGGLLIRLGLVVLMIALPLAAIYSRRLVFTLMPVGAGLMLMGSTLIPGNPGLRDIRTALLSPVGIAAMAFGVWIAASILWTPYPRAAMEQFAKSAGTIALAFVVVAALPGRSRTSNLNLMPIGAGLSAVVAAVLVLIVPAQVPAVADLELSTLERAAVGLVLLVWPALSALGVRERWALGGALAVAITIAAVAVWTPAALAGMAAGALAFSLSTPNPRRMGKILAILFALLFLAAPAFPLVAGKLLTLFPGVPLALTKTIAIWADIVREAPERLLTGYGYNTLGRAMSSGFLPFATPANLPFEIWFELGLLGALGAAAITAGAFVAAGRLEEHAAPFVLAGLTCVFVISFWGLATLHLWWINLLAAMAISFGCVLKGQAREERPSTADLALAGPGKNNPRPAAL